MLFVAEYSLTWESLEAVVAKRLEWDDVRPEGFRFVAEYVWQQGDPPFRGIAVIDADEVESLNSFVLHYGPSLQMHIRPATDVGSAIAMLQSSGGRKGRARTDTAGARRSKRR